MYTRHSSKWPLAHGKFSWMMSPEKKKVMQ